MPFFNKANFKTTIALIVLPAIVDKGYTLLVATKLANPTQQQFDFLSDFNEIQFLFVVLLLGPLVETVIFQTLIIDFSQVLFSKRNYLKEIFGIFFSTLAFAFSHAYSNTFIVVMIFPGFLYASLYVVSKHLKLNNFLITFGSHAVSNFMTFLINKLL